MADQPPVPLAQKLSSALPYVLPVFGGLIGVALINTTDHGNPFIGIAAGALAGWALAFVLARVLDGRN